MIEIDKKMENVSNKEFYAADKSMLHRAEEQQQALLQLSKKQWLAGHKNVLGSIQLATSVASKTLTVRRCSVWLYGDERSCIECMDLYDAGIDKHKSGTVLKQNDFPNYFSALLNERVIAANDAHTDKYTCEFSETYLKPNGITSMLDAPIRLAGEAIGVLCCEHVGLPRKWEIDEKNFVASVADFVSIAFELAEHKRTSDELRRHKAKLEQIVQKRTSEINEKNKELEAFTYSISHDLRAPLRHISGYLKIIEEDYVDKIDDTGLEYLQNILNSVSKMNDMIESMLNLSRISIQEINKKEIDLSQLIKDIINQIVPDLKAIELRVNNTTAAVGDAGLLHIAMTNLLDNAVKYSQNVANPLIEFGQIEVNGRDVYYLKDNGCGFDMKYSDKLFTAFQRLHGYDEYQGSGIGLSTVQRIIRKHGGEIWAESEIGKGATFYFYLGAK